MKMPISRLSLLTLLCSLVFSTVPVRADHHAKGAAPLLQTGDRVALVGGGLIERARLNGYLETALTAGAGPKVTGLKFRNLGWSGDTVFNDARSYFGKPKEGRDRLKKIIGEWKPNVVLLNYGAEVALSAGRAWTDEASASKRSAGDWDESVAVFLEGYAKMIEELKKDAGEGLREIVVVAPPPLMCHRRTKTRRRTAQQSRADWNRCCDRCSTSDLSTLKRSRHRSLRRRLARWRHLVRCAQWRRRAQLRPSCPQHWSHCGYS